MCLSDGALLNALLRLLSGVLRSLTASYSANRDPALGGIRHVGPPPGMQHPYTNWGGGAIAADCDDNDKDVSGGGLASGEGAGRYPRPPFLGGTVSLNTAFFFAVLLSLRVRSDVATYAFVLLVVRLFAIYLASRDNIRRGYLNSILGLPCLIVRIPLTTALPLSLERCLFVALQSMVLVVLPLSMPSGQRTCAWNWPRPSIRTMAKAKGSRRSAGAFGVGDDDDAPGFAVG
jgi:hypothetical protein